jgi:hypothetical protein
MKSIRKSDGIGASDRLQDSQRVHQPSRVDDLPCAARSEPVICRTCGAVHSAGRWQWLPLPARHEPRRVRCPACLRIRADDPAGVLTLVGSFIRLHAEELRRLIQDEEARRRQRDPQSRIIWIRRLLDRIDLTTTDIHLPLRIGEAVVEAQGEALHLVRENDGSAIRVRWWGEEGRSAVVKAEGLQPVRRTGCTSTRSQRTMTERWPTMAQPAQRRSAR